MNQIASLALLVGGVALVIIGINATNSFSSDVSRFFTGSPTDKAVWMLIGGLIATCVGLTLTLRNRKRTWSQFQNLGKVEICLNVSGPD